jgi:hypothetical protein
VVGAYGWTHADNFLVTGVLPAEELQLEGIAITGTEDSLWWQTRSDEAISTSLQVMDETGEFVTTSVAAILLPDKQRYNTVYNPGFAGTHFYRLKVEQPDGQESFSEILALERYSNPASFDLTVYPNPGNGLFYLSYPLTNEAKGVISIFEMSGKSIATLDSDASGHTQIDLREFTSGLYILKMMLADGRSAVKKVLLQ